MILRTFSWEIFKSGRDSMCSLERLGESGATHDSQSASRSGVEAWVARNLNGWDDSDAGLSQGWVRCPSGLASLHHSRLSTRSSYQLYSFSGDRRFCYDNHGSFVYDSPNLFCCPSVSVRTGLTGVRSEPGHRTHLTSLNCPSERKRSNCRSVWQENPSKGTPIGRLLLRQPGRRTVGQDQTHWGLNSLNEQPGSLQLQIDNPL